MKKNSASAPKRVPAVLYGAFAALCVCSCGGGTTGGSPAPSGSPSQSGNASQSGGASSGSVGTSSGGASGSATGSGSAGSSTAATGTTGSNGTSGAGGSAASGAAQSGQSGSPSSMMDASAGGHSGGSSGSVSPNDASAGTTGDGSGVVSPGGAVAFGTDRVIVTGVRATTTPAAQSVIALHNGGQTAAQVTSLAMSGADAALFHVTTAVPATIMPGADLQVTVEMTTTGATLPALPPGGAPYNAGSNLLTATLTATSGAGSAQASVFGLLLVQNNFEPTLGQILTTLGHKINVGQAQNDWNPNTSMMATMLPGIETNSDEVAAPLFTKATPTGAVTLQLVARFSPVGLLPYGWYVSTNSATRTTVGTMSMITDAQTSDKARMVNPPLAAGSQTTFDPGTAPFGIWVFSDQKTEQFNEGGNPVNGDYDFSQDAPNTPANVHRMKAYPLKDSAGIAIAKNYLVAVEEAGNGDYQDYVFVIGNVTPAP